jgi:hypothetical protein
MSDADAKYPDTECDTCVDRALTVTEGSELRRCDSCEDGSEWRPALAPEPHPTPRAHEPEVRAPAPLPLSHVAVLESVVVAAAIQLVTECERFHTATETRKRLALSNYRTDLRLASTEAAARSDAVEAEAELVDAVRELLAVRGAP